jgi:hypothetical protein
VLPPVFVQAPCPLPLLLPKEDFDYQIGRVVGPANARQFQTDPTKYREFSYDYKGNVYQDNTALPGWTFASGTYYSGRNSSPVIRRGGLAFQLDLDYPLPHGRGEDNLRHRGHC